MILIAVIVGYILGIAPFVVPKIIEIMQNRLKERNDEQENKEQQEIIDEWINGPNKDNDNKVNQQDIYNEYLTGKVSAKGD